MHFIKILTISKYSIFRLFEKKFDFYLSLSQWNSLISSRNLFSIDLN